MTAGVIPVAVLMAGAAADLTVVALEKKGLAATVRMACDRSEKTRLVNFPTAESRAEAAKHAFDNFHRKASSLPVKRNVTVTEGKTTVEASTSVPLIFASMLKTGASAPISEQVTCDSIPAYPKVDEVIYDADFARKVDGTAFPLQNGAWGITEPETAGWTSEPSYQLDPSAQCGLEVQNWEIQATTALYRNLPPGYTSPIVLELDGNCNTTISKAFELHPGTYEFSVWYRGRIQSYIVWEGVPYGIYDTNQIGVYLVPADPVTYAAKERLSSSNKRLTMVDPYAQDWVKYNFSITVDEYSIYRLFLRGEGADDSLGGLISTIRIKYKGMDDDD